jgi:hypothetical protein
MVFTLEALDADHGDSLLLRFGNKKSPELIVIDGGPSGIYSKSLKKRLDQLRAARRLREDEPLPIRMLMVSHIDDDHINGVLDLMDELADAQQNDEPQAYSISTIWFNSFDDLVGKNSAAMVSAVSASGPPPGRAAGSWVPSIPLKRAGAVVASIGQGRTLRDLARRLAISKNSPLNGGMVVTAKKGKREVSFGELKLTVVGPSAARVEKLQAKWDEYVEKKGLADKEKAAGEVAAYLDRSVYNLSSIVVLAEFKGKSMLLTGDALGKDVLEGLEKAKLLEKGGMIRVGLLKLPHHGSSRNVAPDFFERIRADHYVASGDGKHDNPEKKTLEMIVAARGTEKYSIHLTYPQPADAAKYLAAESKKRKNLKVIYRGASALSLEVPLM